MVTFDRLDDNAGTLVRRGEEAELIRFSSDLGGQLRPTFLTDVKVMDADEDTSNADEAMESMEE